MGNESYTELWSYFNKIYCINLIERVDRREEATHVFKEYEIPATFYSVDRHPTSPVQGCFESHVQIIQEAYEKNYDRILIFEDDVVATNQLTINNLRRTIDFLKHNDKWEIFFYSMEPDIVFYRSRRITPHIRKVHGYWGNAYALSRRAIKKYVQLTYTGIPIDLIYVKNDQAYAPRWSMFTQSASPSDLRDSTKDGGSVTPTALEYYTNCINIPIINIIFGISVFILFLVTSLGITPHYQLIWILIGGLAGFLTIILLTIK